MSDEQPEFFSYKGDVSLDSWSMDELRAEVKSLYKGYPDTSVATRQELIEILERNRPISELAVKKSEEIMRSEYNIEETGKPTKKPWWQSGQYE